jgi:hypothetical protein
MGIRNPKVGLQSCWFHQSFMWSLQVTPIQLTPVSTAVRDSTSWIRMTSGNAENTAFRRGSNQSSSLSLSLLLSCQEEWWKTKWRGMFGLTTDWLRASWECNKWGASLWWLIVWLHNSTEGRAFRMAEYTYSTRRGKWCNLFRKT